MKSETAAGMFARSPLDAKVETLRAILRACEDVCIGYSGGADSVLLARVAVDTLGAEHMLAVTGLSAAYPEVQRTMARDCAAQFGIPHIEIDTDELKDPSYTANPANRCYFCKSELWPKLREVARARGIPHVLDGSNADDAQDYRPGFAAGRENGVRSPLLEAGFDKADVRALSRRLGLPTWDQPSAPCLSSRLPYGIAVTPARLGAVERAEAALRTLGFRELRVRHHDDCARIELHPREIDVAWHSAAAVIEAMSATGFGRLLLDIDGYRRGALNEALIQLGGTRQKAESLPVHEVAGYHRDIAVLRRCAPGGARRHAEALRAHGYRYITVDLTDAGVM